MMRLNLGFLLVLAMGCRDAGQRACDDYADALDACLQVIDPDTEPVFSDLYDPICDAVGAGDVEQEKQLWNCLREQIETIDCTDQASVGGMAAALSVCDPLF